MENKKKTFFILDLAIAYVDELTGLLQEHGHLVLKANDGKEGVKLVSNENVDLVISDPHITEKEGPKILDDIMDSAKHEIPLLFTVSDKKEENEVRKTFGTHTVDVVVGAKDPETVSQRIDSFLELQQLREENKKLKEEIKTKEELVVSANNELQSFSYTVSHDLRAPLRAINGFTQILEDEHGKDMKEEALRLFSMIKHNAQKMGLLIDDLLAFSRLSRKEIVIDTVNMNDIVFAVINEIKKNQPHNAEIKTLDLPESKGDFSLLKQLFTNLLSNAIKFSSKQQKPEIVIGATKGEKENIYYIKDNGVGFNMTYVDKLFGVFQRLHSESEFPGTGIGLAMVKRIATMHGGKVWAEGKADAGATFYFSLPNSRI